MALSGLCFAFHGRPMPTSANLFTICKRRVRLHGPLRGLWYALKRILRCHPWATPVFDPVPPICSGDDQSNADGRTPADGTAATASRPDEKVFVMNSDNRNLLLAVALSMAVLFGWQILVVGPEMEKEAAQQQLLQSNRKNSQPRHRTPQATAAVDQPGTGAIKPRQAIRQQPSPIRQSGLSSTRRWSAVPSRCRVPALMTWF